MKFANKLMVATILLSTPSCGNDPNQRAPQKRHPKESTSEINTYTKYLSSGRYENIIAKCRAPSKNLERIHISGIAEGGDGENPVIFTEDIDVSIKRVPSIVRGPLFMDKKAIESANTDTMQRYLNHYPMLLDDPPTEMRFFGWKMPLNDLCRKNYMFDYAIIIDKFTI